MFEDGKQSSYHKCHKWNSRYAGKEAFTTGDGLGYKHGSIWNRKIKAHRVIWCLVYGEWPDGKIDHISGDRADNRISNLRVVDDIENARNMARRYDNNSGCTGVSKFRCSQWRARIHVNGEDKFLGLFDSKDEAIAARQAAEKKYGHHINHGR